MACRPGQRCGSPSSAGTASSCCSLSTTLTTATGRGRGTDQHRTAHSSSTSPTSSSRLRILLLSPTNLPALGGPPPEYLGRRRVAVNCGLGERARFREAPAQRDERGPA